MHTDEMRNQDFTAEAQRAQRRARLRARLRTLCASAVNPDFYYLCSSVPHLWPRLLSVPRNFRQLGRAGAVSRGAFDGDVGELAILARRAEHQSAAAHI